MLKLISLIKTNIICSGVGMVCMAQDLYTGLTNHIIEISAIIIVLLILINVTRNIVTNYRRKKELEKKRIAQLRRLKIKAKMLRSRTCKSCPYYGEILKVERSIEKCENLLNR